MSDYPEMTPDEFARSMSGQAWEAGAPPAPKPKQRASRRAGDSVYRQRYEEALRRAEHEASLRGAAETDAALQRLVSARREASLNDQIGAKEFQARRNAANYLECLGELTESKANGFLAGFVAGALATLVGLAFLRRRG